VNGARPTVEPLNSIMGGLTATEYAELTAQVGANWFPGTTAVPVDYPASVGPVWGWDAPSGDGSIASGQAALHAAIMSALSGGGQPIVVAALSMGTIVVDQELAFLATAPDAPAANLVTFVVFASPNRGVASLFPAGLTLPVFGYTTRSIPESQYNIDVVFTEYDAWGDFPDRPWNLFAAANAAVGFVLRPELHTPTALADPSAAVLVSSTTNAMSGTTNTYMLPTRELPLTDPFRLLGAPSWITDAIDAVLRPLVDAGFSRNDVGPLRLPYISQGGLVVPGLTALGVAPADGDGAPEGRPLPATASTDVGADPAREAVRPADDVPAHPSDVKSAMGVTAPERGPCAVRRNHTGSRPFAPKQDLAITPPNALTDDGTVSPGSSTGSGQRPVQNSGNDSTASTPGSGTGEEATPGPGSSRAGSSDQTGVGPASSPTGAATAA